MKKSTLVTLLLVLVLSFGFAGNGYIDEAYNASYKVSSGYEFEVDGEGMVAVGFATNSESFAMEAALDAEALVTRERLLQSSLAVDFTVKPSVDFTFDMGIFDGDINFYAVGELAKEYVAPTGSTILKGLDLGTYGDFNFYIPVKNRRNYFGISTSYNFGYEKSQFLGNEGIELGGSVGFGYYLPRAKADAVTAYTHSTLDAKNDFDYTLNVDARFGYDKGTYLADSLEQYGFINSSAFANSILNGALLMQFVDLDTTYYLPFAAKNNVMSFNLYAGESSAYLKDNSSFKINGGANFAYYLKIVRGANAHDYFSVSANIGAEVKANVENKVFDGSSLSASTDVSVYIPRMIPVELVDNFSLSVPAQFKFGFDMLKKFGTEGITPSYDYSVDIYPFYWELRNGTMLLNMYVNAAELKASFGETRGAKFACVARDLNVIGSIYLDPAQGTSKSLSASTLSAEFDYDMYNSKKSVTISLGAEF